MANTSNDSTAPAERAPTFKRHAPISAEITGWRTSEQDTGNELHEHFEHSFGRWDWCEISNEGARVWDAMFGEPMEWDSPSHNVLSAVAAQAQHGVFAALAAATGEDIDALRLGLAYWLEAQDNPPPPVTFRKMVNMGKQSLEDIANTPLS